MKSTIPAYGKSLKKRVLYDIIFRRGNVEWNQKESIQIVN